MCHVEKPAFKAHSLIAFVMCHVEKPASQHAVFVRESFTVLASPRKT
jgi:hypothetical protein